MVSSGDIVRGVVGPDGVWFSCPRDMVSSGDIVRGAVSPDGVYLICSRGVVFPGSVEVFPSLITPCGESRIVLIISMIVHHFLIFDFYIIGFIFMLQLFSPDEIH